MGRIYLHPGFHAPEVAVLVAQAWRAGDLVVFCPPRIKEYGFLEALPPGEIECVGDWGRRRPALPPGRHGTDFPEPPLFGVFTSGTSSGKPRLALYSRRNLEHSLDGILSLFDASRLTTVFCYPQPSHAFGLVLGYVLCARHGYRLVTGAGRYSTDFHERRAACPGEGLLTLGAPTHFADLLAHLARKNRTLAPSYSAIVGGAPVPAELWRKMRDVLRIEAPSIGYGATEASLGVSHLPPGVEPREDGEIGQGLPSVRVELTEHGLQLSGPSVALAIWEEGKLLHPDAWVLADEIRRRPDGRMVFLGRRDAFLNRGAEKFSFGRMEAVLRRHTDRDILCLALPDPRLGEELGVLVSGAPIPDPEREALSDALEDAFARRFAGAIWKGVPEIPLGDNGKPDRAAGRRLFGDLRAPGSFPVATEALAHRVPHRPPMVWIDEVLRADAQGGECRLVFRSAAPYAGSAGLRRSSLVELMAQAYAFSRAAVAERDEPPRRAFLAAMTGIEFAREPLTLTEGDTLTVAVRCLRELGSLSLIEGDVRNAEGRSLAKGQLKVYAE